MFTKTGCHAHRFTTKKLAKLEAVALVEKAWWALSTLTPNMTRFAMLSKFPKEAYIAVTVTRALVHT